MLQSHNIGYWGTELVVEKFLSLSLAFFLRITSLLRHMLLCSLVCTSSTFIGWKLSLPRIPFSAFVHRVSQVRWLFPREIKKICSMKRSRIDQESTPDTFCMRFLDSALDYHKAKEDKTKNKIHSQYKALPHGNNMEIHFIIFQKKYIKKLTGGGGAVFLVVWWSLFCLVICNFSKAVNPKVTIVGCTTLVCWEPYGSYLVLPTSIFIPFSNLISIKHTKKKLNFCVGYSLVDYMPN